MFPMPLPPRKILLSLYSNSSRNFFMGFKDFLLMKCSASSPAHKYVHLLHSCSPSSQTLSLPSKCRKNLRIFAPPMHFCPSFQRVSGCSYAPYSAMPISRPVNGEDVVTLEKQFSDQRQLMMLKQKLQEIGIDGSECIPGRYSGLMCPSCNGGDKHVKSLSLYVSEDGGEAVWNCCRSKCGWKGNTSAFAKVVSKIKKPKIKQPTRIIDEKRLGLEPLGNERFAIAFPYRRDGELISCKYHSIPKRFWREANTENIFYGLDDIKGKVMSSFYDRKYKYIWSGKDYTAEASRIILATDGDPPGRALAEEHARRLGRERCWRVKWPKKNATENFKDANEVLMYMGPDALKEVIQTAQL